MDLMATPEVSVAIPGTPTRYPNGLNCEWIFSAGGGRGEITLTFQHFKLESGWDFLIIGMFTW